ncbi:F-box domain-containing protein [Entamoeba marina]
MSHLETMYMANVLLYIHTETCFRNFRLVSKKCKEAIACLRINPRMVYDNYKFLFMFFPKLNTISGDVMKIQNALTKDQLEQITWIDCNMNYVTPSEIKEELVSKIISLRIHSMDIHLTRNFPFLKKLVILVSTKLNTIDCINAKLKKLIIDNKRAVDVHTSKLQLFAEENPQCRISLIGIPLFTNLPNIHYFSVDLKEPHILTPTQHIQTYLEFSQTNFDSMALTLEDVKLLIRDNKLQTLQFTKLKRITKLTLQISKTVDTMIALPFILKELSVVSSSTTNFVRIKNLDALSHLTKFRYEALFDTFTFPKLSQGFHRGYVKTLFNEKVKINNIEQISTYNYCGVIVFTGNFDITKITLTSPYYYPGFDSINEVAIKTGTCTSKLELQKIAKGCGLAHYLGIVKVWVIFPKKNNNKLLVRDRTNPLFNQTLGWIPFQ